MKKFLLIAATLLTACPVLFSQEITDAQKAAEEAAKAISEAPKTEEKVKKPRYWTNSLLTKIDFGQSSFTNWAAGGYNNYTLKSFIDANANYRKKELFFNNRLQLDYGFLYSKITESFYEKEQKNRNLVLIFMHFSNWRGSCYLVKSY